MVIYVLMIAASVGVAIMSILYLNNLLQDIIIQDEGGAQASLDAAQQHISTYFIIFTVLIAVAVVFTIYCLYNIAARIKNPLSVLGRATYHLTRTGNLKLPAELAAEMKRYEATGDEISSVIVSFEMMVKSLLQKVEVLEMVAQGDLRSRVIPASDEDYLGIAVNAVVTNLNTIVSDVINATEQLSVGANQLSVGAQSLSQSASEQSATMDKLHESAGEIASEAAENAERAAEASVLTANIRANATEGGRKMVDMTIAMSEINKASHSIGSVMKVIDEIAFQTNILALNAAVEAARAGVHGKGFAVVADEVRNLATKSGEAANDTNAMIADTITKSDMGTKIVDEAIAFFKTIEEGIANINELLNEIAKAAKSQSYAIERVTKSLTDMTNVVYHNSATSEQSAAASEEMNSQALLLKEAVNRFLLEEDPGTGLSVTGTEPPARRIDIPDYIKPPLEPEKPEQEEEKPGFTAPVYNNNEIQAYNPTIEPTENGGLSPAEIYAKALERETRGTEQASSPIAAPEAAPVRTSEPGLLRKPDSGLIPMPEPAQAKMPEPPPLTKQEPAQAKMPEPPPLTKQEAAQTQTPEPPPFSAPTAPPAQRRTKPEAEGGFVDDDSKY